MTDIAEFTVNGKELNVRMAMAGRDYIINRQDQTVSSLDGFEKKSWADVAADATSQFMTGKDAMTKKPDPAKPQEQSFKSGI